MSCITRAQVVASSPNRLTVRAIPKPLCQGCASYGTCRLAFGRSSAPSAEIEIPLSAPITVSPGETVQLSMTQKTVRHWVLRAYGAPLAVFLGVIAIGAEMRWHELSVAVLAGVAAFLVFRVTTRRAQIEIQVKT